MLEIDSPENFVALSDATPLLIELTPQLAEMLQKERGVLDSKFNEDRKFARHRCSIWGIIENDGGTNAALCRQQLSKVIIRDISRNGFGVITPEQYYPSQMVRLSLPTGQSLCEVARARYHGPKCFEIGIQVRKFTAYAKNEDQE